MSTNSGVTADALKAVIIEKLGAQHVEVEDLSAGCGQMFEVVIVSPIFEGKRLLARHKLVNEALKEEISKVHAFTQKSYTPEEWEKKKAE
ncbi:Isocitrate dehydrogenase [NADP], mitochondrial precursor (Oxalosuccinate decarboxylase) [Mucor velutinosus]|uniref:Isocitrate dehydrogenase [NADP], mitochondrial (Oxalosuccinate decarboxylase) n=1 Tax=Mucor velutinosus TaxID=708070 RepID=A0AAN7DHZ1_9FUNG|nr:Isocitrate dehydrogenase [NADP], mitochondrial precursor (Oxalosuccinate decarboxylase) [Mucor velutinosus]